jgi:hypothetical protein
MWLFPQEDFADGLTFPSFPTGAAQPTLSAEELAIVGRLPDAYLAHFLSALNGREWRGDDYLVVFMAYGLGKIPSNCLIPLCLFFYVKLHIRNM